MATPYFVADSASVTIMRSLASSSYGSYSLNLPDGIELEDVHDFDVPDNTLGYVAHVGHGRRVGGLARRFVRADVNVAAADPSDPDRFPDSDVDRVLRDVAERVSGDFFLETDVSKAGLGPWVPHVDFKVGDLARVEIWGQVVVLPVTRIEEVVSDHDIVDWRVHVGGQLVSDEEARKAENLALHRAFLQDRRELAGVEGIASQAARTAGEAQVTAGTLDDDLDRSVEVVAGELGLPVPEKEHRLEVSLGEVLAQAIEATQVVQGLAFPQASVVPADFQGRPWWAVGARSSRSEQPPAEAVPEGLADYSFTGFDPDSGGGVEAAYLRISDKVDYKISLWMKGAAGDRAYVWLVDEAGASCVGRWQRWRPEQGDWVSGGAVELVPDTDEPSGWGRYEYVVRLKPGTRRVRVSLAPGSAGSPWVNRLAMSVLNRPQEETDAFQSEQIEQNNTLIGQLEAVTQRLNTVQSILIGNVYAFVDHEIGSMEVPQSTWVEVFSLTVPVAMRYRVTWRVGWANASRGRRYDMSIQSSGMPTSIHYWENLGPLLPWEDGYRTTQMTMDRIVSEGGTIRLLVRSAAPNASQRRIRDGFISLESLD